MLIDQVQIFKDIGKSCTPSIFRKFTTEYDDESYIVGIDERGSICTTHIYCTKHSDRMQEKRQFLLEDGEHFTAKVLSFTDLDFFYERTGIDVRDKWPSIVILTESTMIPRNIQQQEIDDALYYDKNPQLGTKFRGLEVAHQYFKDHQDVKKVCINEFYLRTGFSACKTRDDVEKELQINLQRMDKVNLS